MSAPISVSSTAPTRTAAIALNRFGLGARPDDTAGPRPADWLAAQIDRSAANDMPAAWRSQPATSTLIVAWMERRRALQAQRRSRPDAAGRGTTIAADGQQPASGATSSDAAATAEAMQINALVRETYRSAVDARFLTALTTQAPFFERLVYFWSNHFALSSEKQPVALLAGAFETEAIRPHVLGRFSEMLVAVEQHPAMLLFLDQNVSVGPDSPAANRVERQNAGKHPGLNENLARETMELHTLGVRSGYSQNDVTEFARALTGWGIGGITAMARPDEASAPGQCVFRPARHEPGARVIMGKTYPQNGQGQDQALAALADFAASPATARHIAEKLSRHFVADTPPPALVDRLADAFNRSGGDLPTVYRALIDAPEAWQPANAKFKTPWEWSVSALRGMGWTDPSNLRAAPLMAQLGQPVWRPGSPAGFDDVAASWAAPDALMRRVEVAQRWSGKMGDRIDARALAPKLLGPALQPSTLAEIGRAESAQDALALLLVSPDFLRR